MVEVGLVERQRLMDAQNGSPQDYDQGAQSASVQSIAGRAHDCDDLLDARRIGRIAQIFVALTTPGVEPRQRGRRTTTAGGIEQQLGHAPCSGLKTEPPASRRASYGDPSPRRREPTSYFVAQEKLPAPLAPADSHGGAAASAWTPLSGGDRWKRNRGCRRARRHPRAQMHGTPAVSAADLAAPARRMRKRRSCIGGLGGLV